MLSGPVIITVSLLYLCLLFAIAYYGDKRADQGRSLIANPTIYALSIAVYCTSWTFYGSVGRAASSGADFLPIYLGPTLTFILAWFVIRKIIRISKVNRTTSIADFIASRYGKSFQLGALVTIIAVVGILPYISLQLKAISTSFSVLLQYPEIVMPSASTSTPVLQDTGLYVALIMALFAILFGTRHIDASEQHEGMVAAIAFESVVKLVAFVAVGLFVTFGLYGGFGDIFAQAEGSGALRRLFTIDGVGSHTSWIMLTVLAMGAIVVLPRQFQVLVVENVDERHLRKAMWLFPLYLLLINIFVLPIAFAGLLLFPGGGVDADTFVLTVPMQEQQPMLALIVFIGGLSAATGMIIVETVALATMVQQRSRHAAAAAGRPPAPFRAQGSFQHPADDPSRHHHPRGVARLCLCPSHRRIACAGDHRARVVRGGDAVRAGDHRRHLLERRDQGRRARRARRRIPGMDLHAAAAVLRALGLDRPEFRRERAAGDRAAQAVRAVRARWAGPDRACHDLDDAGECRALCRRFAGDVAVRHRAQPGGAIRRHLQAGGRGGRVWRGRATIGDLRQLLVRFMGETRANAAFARFERENQATQDRARPTRISSRYRSASSPAPSAPPRRASWSPRAEGGNARHRRGGRFSTRLRNWSSIRASSSRNRASSRPRRPSCEQPTSASRSSTS